MKVYNLTSTNLQIVFRKSILFLAPEMHLKLWMRLFLYIIIIIMIGSAWKDVLHLVLMIKHPEI